MNPATSAPSEPQSATNQTLFHVKTERFEGPLELLLELVEKRKLLINDISLATVTNEYLELVSDMQERSLPHTAQFVALAATLLLIKSKSLLPVLELTEDESEHIEDLEHTLRYYQIFRDAGLTISRHYGQSMLAERPFRAPTQPLFMPDSYCQVETLHQALHELVSELPIKPPKPKVQVRPTITLEEMIDRITTRVARDFKLSFAHLHRGETERKTIAVGFLAILELCKQGTIIVRQSQHFADIEIEAARLDTPRYE